MKQILQVAVGSTNPTKVNAVKWVVEQIFDGVTIVAIEVPSGISEQPMSADETKRGAHNRAEAALRQTGADWAFGLEGGVDIDEIGVGWLGGCVAVVNSDGQSWSTREFTVALPSFITQKLLAGEELGPLMDEITGDKDSKRKLGAIGYLSKGIISREDSWKQGVVRVLIPFLNSELYGDLLAATK
ncbi:MAG: inosine/xanthosine triphosphatase [Bacilli bacterium]|nr:inosine/xanthosine triphosphatase [Bacilli bacterium]